MRLLGFVFLLVLNSGFALADQVATLTCTGERVVLTEKSPYLGEDSRYSQSLFVLSSKDGDESSYTAYFLDVEEDIGGVRHGGAGTLVFTGANSKGGSFQLIISPWQDVGDGTVIHETSRGVITYKHGPLLGKSEPVECVRQ
ncbi:hypothetical protein AZI87_13830 [Bdellovibrio bacteriovorus]|uniref:Uncharacterized protein n=1 Tax=Bdellovibrio bacteriovorus TaxID=959 RepID=A0A162G4G0_BDEBC|nr:hypothetical protein [Bdellovibrio bacteriovorus]KYG64310.1 hypothetical protein AZI87_13830 [Bdellovibrio bacteriovorus]